MRTAVAAALTLGLAACSSSSSAGPVPFPSSPAATSTSSALPPSPSAGVQFGPLPAPALRVPSEGEPIAPPDTVQPYFGPARMTWSGTLPVVPATAPVLRYTEPTQAQADSFASTLGAQNSGAPPQPPLIASYQASGFSLSVLQSESDLEVEPRYILTPPGSEFGGPPADDSTARSAAAGFLAAHQLAPAWPSQVVLDRVRAPALVVYNRQFAVPGAAPAVQVNAQADLTGLEVTVSGSSVFQVAGPLPLPLDQASYPVIPPADAVPKAVIAAAVANSRPIIPTPAVTLTQARLVYLAVPRGGRGYFEPAYLFTGTFKVGPIAYEKRVLVPAVQGSHLLP